MWPFKYCRMYSISNEVNMSLIKSGFSTGSTGTPSVMTPDETNEYVFSPLQIPPVLLDFSKMGLR